MGFLRKIAGAFVVLDERGEPTSEAAPAPAPALDDITKETSTLLAQLEGSAAHERAPDVREPGGSGAAGEAGDMPSLTAEDVFRREGLGDGPNSALRLLRLIAGLGMFPREQQVAMVRAMDAADDTWAEADVVADAHARQRVLRAHLDVLAAHRSERARALADEMVRTQESGDAVLQEIDRRIAELTARRQEEAQTTARALSALEQQQREVDASEQQAREGVTQVLKALEGLLTFLGSAPRGEEPG